MDFATFTIVDVSLSLSTLFIPRPKAGARDLWAFGHGVIIHIATYTSKSVTIPSA